MEEAEKRLPREDEDPIATLRAYHGKGSLEGQRAGQWLEEIGEDRKDWRG